MSNLTYNPNVNIPYHSNKYNKYESYNNYEDNDNYENDDNYEHYEMDNQSGRQLSLPQMDPRANMPPKMPRQMNNKYKQNNIKKKKQNNFKNKYNEESDETDYDIKETKSNKIVWSLIIKKIVIFTALFLLMSHIKTDELICKFVPYLSENQLICMTIKGLILSILIIIIQLLLK
jgi:hypothetical protein